MPTEEVLEELPFSAVSAERQFWDTTSHLCFWFLNVFVGPSGGEVQCLINKAVGAGGSWVPCMPWQHLGWLAI